MTRVLKSVLGDVRIVQETNQADCQLVNIKNEDDIALYRFEVKETEEFIPYPIALEWKVPAVNVKGVWKPTADFNKRIEADWELENHESRISIDAPVLALFGNSDENIICFSCSNAINRIELAAKYREEDNHFYCKIIFFTECRYPIQDFSADIRLDYRKVHFSEALKDTSKWWEEYEELRPLPVPEIAKKPLYSTWYQFHQYLDEEQLLSECKLAKSLGFEAIIIDDGWQTKDNNRGYDYTGDWQPERFSDFGALVKQIQDGGMKVGLWYSVPFCGQKSEAYQKFKGKFLTEDHRWAPVFDPRYAEVREYLVQTYVEAVKNWNLDGLKLDFIDDFKSYPDTCFEKAGKDFLSINKAVDMLLTEVSTELQKIKPEIFIEFRQKYTGPAMRKYGNMLRAFDCPGDYTMNRVRIADIRMLAGNTAVHADMVKWHFDETVESAALHYLNTLFGVPQLSVMLGDAPGAHLKMITFYTKYWNSRAHILLEGRFTPCSPLSNYPIQRVELKKNSIIGVYEDHIIKLLDDHVEIDFLNAKLSTDVIIKCAKNLGVYNTVTFDCQGNTVSEENMEFKKGLNAITIPPCGLMMVKKV